MELLRIVVVSRNGTYRVLIGENKISRLFAKLVKQKLMIIVRRFVKSIEELFYQVTFKGYWYVWNNRRFKAE
jgi:hypothetical protein